MLTLLSPAKEIMTFAHIMDLISSMDLAAAMDVLSQRILAIQRAKAKDGSWSKAGKAELVMPPGAATASTPFDRLTA